MSQLWQDVGELNVTTTGRLPLKYIPDQPGLYRLISDNQCYVGQAMNVRNRVYEYCRPTQHLEHEHRLHLLLKKKPCRVEVLITPEMRSLSYRRAQEKIAMSEAQNEGFVLWNLSVHPKLNQYQMLIQYHEAMIEKYKQLLAAGQQEHKQ